MKINHRIVFYLISLIVAIIDQVLKYLARHFLVNSNIVLLLPNIVGLQLAQNTGAAFSLFSEYTMILSIISLIIVIAIVVSLSINTPDQKILLIGWSFICGGSLGNLIDRVVHGMVTDYIILLFVDFPIFNFADIAINIGIALLMKNFLVQHIKLSKNGRA